MTSVGVFDSGVGGLSVLSEIRKLAPGVPLVYLADQHWAPYGERSLEEVRARSVAIARFLIDRGCDPVVLACNSASAAALHHLRNVFPDNGFVGMEPAVKPAASRSERGVIGVLATSATFQGELYASVVDRHANEAEIVEQACPGLADAVERLGPQHAETIGLLTTYVTPLVRAGVDTVVLGCTHYSFLMDAIERLAGPDVHVIDPAPAVARQTMRMLGDRAPESGDSVFLTTGSADVFSAQLGSLLGLASQPRKVRMDMATGTDILVVTGDLTRQNVDAIVNAANNRLQHGGGVAAAIVRAGGRVVQEESNAWIQRNGVLPPDGAAVTTAGSMPARHVIHVAGPIHREDQDNEGLLRSAVKAALDAAADVGARSVAFPAISAGIYGYPVAEAT
ncbi:MAG: glutamate racemase, partial [Acidimicrobiia bacterium]|nr:glutamate racemase [Acidimicrobiia bacterium]